MERLAHIPVMLEECMEGLNLKDNGIYFDGTLGGGGHSFEILTRTSAGRLVATDLDTESIARAKEKLAEFEGRFAIAHDNYKNFKYVLKENGIEAVDGILLDFGVSSFQLDDKSRGFSYNADCALDMRMNPDQSLTAKEVVNTYSEEALRRILSEYGEERFSGRIAKEIAAERKKREITRSTELIEIIERSIPKKFQQDGHPARRTFQAIRIEVNRELDDLKETVLSMARSLKKGGRIVILTFHSLEDRIVKQAFKELETDCVCDKRLPVCVCGKKKEIEIITKKPVTASARERGENPRSRSAKLRIAEKI